MVSITSANTGISIPRRRRVGMWFVRVVFTSGYVRMVVHLDRDGLGWCNIDLLSQIAAAIFALGRPSSWWAIGT